MEDFINTAWQFIQENVDVVELSILTMRLVMAIMWLLFVATICTIPTVVMMGLISRLNLCPSGTYCSNVDDIAVGKIESTAAYLEEGRKSLDDSQVW